MDLDSLIKTSASSFASGIFSMVVILSLIGLPGQGIHHYGDLVVKGPQPYVKSVTHIISQNIPSNFKTNKKEKVFHAIILKAARDHSVDPALIKAIIMAESGYDPTAVSRKGAIGLMQIMPATADELGVEDLFNPVHNVNAGVRYFKRLLNQFEGDIELALAAYNVGSRKVREYQGIPPFKATINYINKVFKYYHYYQGSII